ncbi:MAG: DUF3256 family protein [Muribaculaceae bacterium]|nr:DUF3256 family protein [Muribaculaceae bacterium]
MTLPQTGRCVRKWLLTAICLVTSVAGLAAMNEEEPLTASKVFAEAPLEVLDMLRPSTRLDMLDYYNQADSLLTVTNALEGGSRLEQVASDYMRVAMTPVSTLEIKILRAGKRQIVMTLYTVGGDGMAKDTDVRFFDSTLKPIDGSRFLKAPDLTDFFSVGSHGIGKKELREKIPFMAVCYSTGPGDEPLKATFTTLDVVSQEDRDILSPLLNQYLSAPWKGSYRF